MMMQERLRELGDMTRRLQQEFPRETEGFLGFLKEAEDGTSIARKQKELIAIALALAAQCEWCIAFHVQNAVRAGASRSEIIEAGFQAVVMHGGPAFMGMVTLLQAAGLFEREIVPVEVKARKGMREFIRDEHNRPDTTAASLAALRPAFRKDGTITAGNAPGPRPGGPGLAPTGWTSKSAIPIWHFCAISGGRSRG